MNLDHPAPGVSITFGWETGDIDGESAGGEEEEEEEEDIVRLNSGCTDLDHTPFPGALGLFGWSKGDTGDYGLLALLFALFLCLRQIRSIRPSLN